VTIETPLVASPIAAKEAKKSSWQQVVKPYQSSDTRRSIIEVLTSIPPFFVMWYITYRSLELSFYPVTLFLAFLTAMFAMRCFIILHDAGHGSFFKNQKWNDFFGIITGIITFTPYFAWRHSHAIHHASSGDLDRRGTGDVWTLTYDEYHTMPLAKRAFYRLYRNPLVIFVVGPAIDFVILQRLPTVNVGDKAREKYSVVYTNITLLVLAIVMSLLIGVKDFVLVQLPVIAFASSLGVFLFYVQHQFEDAYWARHKDWNYAEAALHGSSFFKMGPIMKFFTGNIGFHHIHHLSPKIPNYKLEACHYENEMFEEVAVMTWRSSLKSVRIRTFDEDRGKMIGYYRDDEHEEVAAEAPIESSGLLPATD
jgi:omega-6 fatty acid desaturase (delta-12 desaturase)